MIAINQYPVGLSHRTRLERTKSVMNVKHMTDQRYQSLKQKTKEGFFYHKTHGNLVYRILKTKFQNPSKPLHSIFPRMSVSFKKQMYVNRIGNLPSDITGLIKEYAFFPFDEVVYSLFDISEVIFNVFSKNTDIKYSLSRMVIAFNDGEEDETLRESWHWEYMSTYFHASNCHHCGGYKTSNTGEIASTIICRCSV